tara:strand:+ start:485 stop:715 length:231 start_codon:yes stop_codon:yes gene_type:complete
MGKEHHWIKTALRQFLSVREATPDVSKANQGEVGRQIKIDAVLSKPAAVFIRSRSDARCELANQGKVGRQLKIDAV